MKRYSQLTLAKRYGIYSLLKTGHNQSEIAKVIGVHKSTVSREFERNCGGRGYRHKQANTKAIDRRQGKSNVRIDGSTWMKKNLDLHLFTKWIEEQRKTPKVR
jgi:IS30 family transposase